MTKNNTTQKSGRRPIYDKPMIRKTLYLPQWMWDSASKMGGAGGEQGVRAIVERVLSGETPKEAKTYEHAMELQEIYDKLPHALIQWKGTNVCMDVRCACGETFHIDAEFCYAVKCIKCGRIFFCNSHIELIEVKDIGNNHFVISFEEDY